MSFIVKYMKKTLDITEIPYSKHILPVPQGTLNITTEVQMYRVCTLLSSSNFMTFSDYFHGLLQFSATAAALEKIAHLLVAVPVFSYISK